MSQLSLDHVFEDLTSGFFINLPNEEFSSFERLFFQLEQAFWFYSDHYSDSYDHLPKFKLKSFCHAFFLACPILRSHVPHFDTLFSRFIDYLTKVPVCGVILLNRDLDKVLMVQSWQGKSWGFPKGKVNHGEEQIDAAVREVFEETGLRLARSDLDAKDCLSMKGSLKGREVNLFVVGGVADEFPFEVRTRKEIRSIRWFPVEHLPTGDSPTTEDNSKFWEVRPFTSRLLKWIEEKQKSQSIPRPSRRNNRRSRTSSGLENANPSFPRSQSGPTDSLTFGQNSGRWTVEQMFKTNEKLFNVRPSGETPNPEITEAERLKFRALTGKEKRQHHRPHSAPPPLDVSSISSIDSITFGPDGHEGGWSLKDMFAVNEAKFGVKPGRDGANPEISDDERARFRAIFGPPSPQKHRHNDLPPESRNNLYRQNSDPIPRSAPRSSPKSAPAYNFSSPVPSPKSFAPVQKPHSPPPKAQPAAAPKVSRKNDPPCLPSVQPKFAPPNRTSPVKYKRPQPAPLSMKPLLDFRFDSASILGALATPA